MRPVTITAALLGAAALTADLPGVAAKNGTAPSAVNPVTTLIAEFAQIWANTKQPCKDGESAPSLPSCFHSHARERRASWEDTRVAYTA
jgi:hypothetical protein